MAITDKEKGVWGLDQVYNKQNQGSIWSYSTSEVEQFTYNTLFSWGSGSNSALGQGSNTDRSSPTQVPGTGWTQSNSDTFGNQYKNFSVVKSDGTMWTWGENKEGSMGIPSVAHNEKIVSPIQMGSSTDWKYVGMGDEWKTAIKTDGTLWAWGANEYGGLGQNNTTHYSSPVQIGSDTTWSSLSTQGDNAGFHAIKTDGTLWACGTNFYGVLGQNQPPSTHLSSPVQIPGTTWKAVMAGRNSVGALKTDNTLWIWGRNNQFGKLGLNDLASRSSPTQIPGTDWTLNIDVGYENVAAIKSDGALWVWGYNLKGQLGQNEAGGNNEATSRSSPVQVGSDTTWSTVGQGTRYVLASKTDGTLWSWGTNAGGVLGQNQPSNSEYSSPVQVGSATHWAGAKFNSNGKNIVFTNT